MNIKYKNCLWDQREKWNIVLLMVLLKYSKTYFGLKKAIDYKHDYKRRMCND
jgi:hypothetical protein